MSNASNHFRIPKDQVFSLRFLSAQAKSTELLRALQRNPQYSFFWARNALYHSLSALGVAPGDKVLLPAYICAAPVEAVEAFGAQTEFYEVLSDCTPDFSDLEKKIDARTRAVLAVHYFGFPQRIGELRSLCDAHRLFLLEDCAHVLSGEAEGRLQGAWGEFSFFSWRKFLPTFDGADLLCNVEGHPLRVEWSTESALFTLKVAKSVIDRRLEARPNFLSALGGKMMNAMKARAFKAANGAADSSGVLKVHSESASFDSALVRFPMTRISHWISRHSDVESIVARRRGNYLQLQELLSDVHGLSFLHPSLPPKVCPWVVPVVFDGRSSAHLQLRDLGLPATTWGGVRPRNIDAAKLPNADRLYERIVFLPVHQDLTESDLAVISQAVRQTAGRRSND